MFGLNSRNLHVDVSTLPSRDRGDHVGVTGVPKPLSTPTRGSTDSQMTILVTIHCREVGECYQPLSHTNVLGLLISCVCGSLVSAASGTKTPESTAFQQTPVSVGNLT